MKEAGRERTCGELEEASPSSARSPGPPAGPRGCPKSEGNGQAFAAHFAQTPGWLPQEGRTLAPQEWTPGSCTSTALSGRPSSSARRAAPAHQHFLPSAVRTQDQKYRPACQAHTARREASVPSRGVQRLLPCCSAFE